MNDLATLEQFAAATTTLQREVAPTLLQLARAAIQADEAERAFLLSDDPADDWQGVGDTRDIDLNDAKRAAADAFFAALERITGIDRHMFDKLERML